MRPDLMSAEEWRAQLECEPAEGSDPEEYPDEEDYLSPHAVDLTAELAEIAAAARFAALASGQVTDAEDGADPVGVADALMAQAAAASARRRGPGQPGSARLLAGSRPAGRRRSGPGCPWT